ncbi:type I 3-dehydroquinate dehydratase [Cytobacillus depressus]|uniref:type I 3-dehydroquinate dehydratase n=1 Tax=Cytobacillus depressus TaxID=1602942 RepID=UPI00147812F5|nr:type I 3-dehydroquinate dehydratase [Cytobacillus depressus]
MFPNEEKAAKRLLTVKNVVIGEDIPKICVPIVGQTMHEIIEEASHLKAIDFDIVEWRADFFEDVEDIKKVKEALTEIYAILSPSPIIFTFRSIKEGGEKEVSSEYYAALNKAIIETGMADMIDIELYSNEEKTVQEVVQFAHANNVFVILSNHDFQKTPSKEEIITRLCRAQKLGADLPKIAVMPKSKEDVLVLLDATLTMNEKFADRPFITMSMAKKGVISRLTGEFFGSAITFGTAKKASAPGQVATSELRKILYLLHQNR